MTAEWKMGVLLSLRTGSFLHRDTFWVPENLLAKEYRALLPALSVRLGTSSDLPLPPPS
jgi:hypothetical protein